MAADERYARQLAEHYNGAATYGGAPRPGPNQSRGALRNNSGTRPNQYEEEREHSFIDGTEISFLR